MTHESEGDWGETQLDQAEQAEAEINLDDPDAVPADEDVVGGGGIIDPGSELGPEAAALHLEP